MVSGNSCNYTSYWIQTYQRRRKCISRSWSRLRHLGLHEDNYPEESGQEYCKSIFNMDENTVNSIDSDQNINNKFKIDSIKYFLDENDLDNTRLQDTNTYTTGTDSLPGICNLDREKIKQL